MEYQDLSKTSDSDITVEEDNLEMEGEGVVGDGYHGDKCDGGMMENEIEREEGGEEVVVNGKECQLKKGDTRSKKRDVELNIDSKVSRKKGTGKQSSGSRNLTK